MQIYLCAQCSHCISLRVDQIQILHVEYKTCDEESQTYQITQNCLSSWSISNCNCQKFQSVFGAQLKKVRFTWLHRKDLSKYFILKWCRSIQIDQGEAWVAFTLGKALGWLGHHLGCHLWRYPYYSSFKLDLGQAYNQLAGMNIMPGSQLGLAMSWKHFWLYSAQYWNRTELQAGGIHRLNPSYWWPPWWYSSAIIYLWRRRRRRRAPALWSTRYDQLQLTC